MRSSTVVLSLFLLFSTSSYGEEEYHMVTATIVDQKVQFESGDDFQEAIKVGFFRIKTPEDINLGIGRDFAKTFTSNPQYNQFGAIDHVNGFLQSAIVQSVRFSLERDHWDRAYSPEIQKLGTQLNEIGVLVLRAILTAYGLPEELWFEATGGSSDCEGSHFLIFNCYDPSVGLRQSGLGAHKDWGHMGVLDAIEPGLEAKIDGIWRPLHLEDGYLTINFGLPLEKLLPGVHASEHRVVTQTDKMRTSFIAFVDPRVGPYRPGVAEEKVGFVYDWDPIEKKLINGEPTTSFFAKLSNELYGK